ncbi:MAG: hypothetical protein GX781_02275 [Clostridiales bacterium]|nr:hypothetical protein [Clostridiales bacterium]
MDNKDNKDQQGHRDQQDHQQNPDHQENKEHKENDNSFKKVAMATFGAISNAVEKVADVIGDATSKENIDKYAKKGEESMAAVKEKSGEVYKQVKDFSEKTVDKVKDSIGDEDIKELKDIAATKNALLAELDELKKTAAKAELRLEYSHTQEEYEEFKDQVSKDLGNHKSKVENLIKHMKDLRKEQRKEITQEEKEELLKELEKQQDQAEEASETAHVSKPADDDIPYESPGFPRDANDRREHAPADYEQASPSAPDKDNNTKDLETNSRNDHLDQSVPPPRG